MSACCNFLEDLLVTAMHAIEDTNGQPGIFQVYFIERVVMSHKCSNGFSD
jgi:hypothetical protein